MDFCQNVTAVSGDQYQPDSSSSKLSSNPLDDLFPSHNTEVDVSLEWLSIFVEDCLSSSGICLPASELPTSKIVQNISTASPESPKPKPHLQQARQTMPPPCLENLVVPSKARSKRKRAAACSSNNTHKLTTKTSSLLTSWTTSSKPSAEDAQLLFCAGPPRWLADSELLILPKRETTITNKKVKADDDDDGEEEEEAKQGGMVMMRRCSHCLSQRTPQWRAGPMGPKTLCNACGVRYKSGRLLPEYRPAKSPTFVSYLHSNAHKKVLEMRMSSMPSYSSSFPPK